MKKLRAVLLVLCVLLALTALGGAAAEEAVSVNGQCAFTVKGASRKEIKKLTDGKYSDYVSIRKGGEIGVDGKGTPLGSVLVQFYDRAAEVEIWARVGDEWVLAGRIGEYLSGWVPLPEGAEALRVVNTDKSRMLVADMTVYGTGERPANSPEWETYDKADLLVAACHPDDELLWLGGLLPTYAGERGLRVQVVYAVPSTPVRRLELLDGLWHCGVKGYPAFLNLPDAFTKTMKAAYGRWGKNKMHSRMTAMIRRYRPEVVVTHDLNGEYGHGGHEAVADTVVKAVQYAADGEKYTDSAKQYGTWQVKKLYLHLYEAQPIRFDWHRPLAAFGGKDGLTVATEALALHRSQTARGWEMEDGGPMDNSRFGLAFSAVGLDEACDDLFEHVWPTELEETETEEAAESEEDSDV